ncbi:hypothetical protein ACJMK2_040103 [Sinanodonta woodiana]|uniref:G-protein coupled receptors family 1 profile domain-containing protein n=1 Tax=Sinanodonta woodiana TaxID=1069815 RepID=A0ABD3WFJ5_SINWO
MNVGVLIETIFICLFLILTVVTNTVILCVATWTESLRNVNKVYLYSMTYADLGLGMFVMPFAVYCSIIYQSGHGSVNPYLCHIQAYSTMIFILASLYSMAWINVDHYLALRKPERYNLKMSRPRSLCWIIFAWIAAISFCLPPLLSLLSWLQEQEFNHSVFICTVQIKSETPYFITAGALVLFPAFVCLSVTNAYLFTPFFKKKEKMYKVVLLEVSTRPKNYHINFVISLIFVGSWMPWCLVKACELFGTNIPAALNFCTFWLAMGNAYYKFFVYVCMSSEFRRGINVFIQQATCKCNGERITLCFHPEHFSVNLIPGACLKPSQGNQTPV